MQDHVTDQVIAEQEAHQPPDGSVEEVEATGAREAEEARMRRRILGRVAAFGAFAFTRSKPRAPRHADTWKDKGPHESTGAAARRQRQMERQRMKAIRKQCELDAPVCPNCGDYIERDMVDVGVGEIPCGPWGCPSCHWVEPLPPELQETEVQHG